ncbi:MAG: hypothetical protein AB8H03_07210 [Saprospiraceae bacterium]
MGLNFSYNIYVKKNKLRDTLKLISENCSKRNNHIEQKNDNFYFVRMFYSDSFQGEIQTQKEILDDVLNSKISLSCSLRFTFDDKILNYIHHQSREKINPNDSNSWKPPFYIDEKFEIGNFDLTFKDSTKIFPETIQVSFTANTSDMSRLIKESTVINKFFKFFCKKVNARYGYLDKEHEGFRLIWFEEKEYNIDFLDKTSLFKKS